MSELDERWTTFRVGGQRVHGMLHLPTGRGPGPHPAVLMLHGFTGQRMEPHRLFVLFSRLLAANGVASMRFDFRGSGESEGAFDEMTVSRELEDLRHATEHLRSQPEVDPARVGLLGLSMGGMVAALGVAEPGLEFKALCLWAPAVPEVWFSQAPPGTTVESLPDPLDSGGHPVSRAFFKELKTLRPLEAVRAHRGPALVVHGAADPTVPVAVGLRYAEALGAPIHVVQQGGHTFESLPTQAEAHRVTLGFFTGTL